MCNSDEMNVYCPGVNFDCLQSAEGIGLGSNKGTGLQGSCDLLSLGVVNQKCLVRTYICGPSLLFVALYL